MKEEFDILFAEHQKLLGELQAMKALAQPDATMQSLKDLKRSVCDEVGKATLAQPEQEPVGWLDSNDKLAEFMHKDLKAEHDKRDSSTPRDFQIPVYITPPQRTWVGLTDEDDIDWEEGGNLKDLVKAIEAKLKEKNNG